MMLAAPAADATADWTIHFEPFSMQHALAVAWSGAVVFLLCREGLRRRGTPRERLVGDLWAGVVIGVNLWSLAYWLTVDHFDIQKSLPLQLCDLACLIAPVALISPWRWPRALLYFWGLGLSTQAYFTPTIQSGALTERYWLFWMAHLAIVGTALYEVIVRRYRPTLRDLAVASGVSVAWAAAVVLLNVAMGTNYGFLGRSMPEAPTIIDRLGPWPGRVFLLAVLGIGFFVVLWGIWRIPLLRPRVPEQARR